MTIYTLEYLEKEAELIAGYWNGSDDRFVDGSGEPRDAEEAEMANDLLNHLEQVKALAKALSI